MVNELEGMNSLEMNRNFRKVFFTLCRCESENYFQRSFILTSAHYMGIYTRSQEMILESFTSS